MKEPECMRCRSRMERGFLVDYGEGDRGKVSHWVEGAPEKSFWTGVKTRGRERYPLVAFRCSKCGYLEFYAAAEGKAGRKG